MNDDLTVQEQEPIFPNSALVEGYDLEVSEDAIEVALAEIMETIDPQGIGIKASELPGQWFYLLRAKAFESSYEGQDHAYYVVGRLVNDDKLFHTVLGGKQVVATLDKLVEAGLNVRAVMELKLVRGGKYGSYYVLS